MMKIYLTDQIDNATIVELEFDGDVVTGAKAEYPAATPAAFVVGEVTRISGDRIRVTYEVEKGNVEEKWVYISMTMLLYTS
jgi:hypothetical protein